MQIFRYLVFTCFWISSYFITCAFVIYSRKRFCGRLLILCTRDEIVLLHFIFIYISLINLMQYVWLFIYCILNILLIYIYSFIHIFNLCNMSVYYNYIITKIFLYYILFFIFVFNIIIYKQLYILIKCTIHFFKCN